MKAKANVATVSVRRVVIFHEGVNMCLYKEGKGSFVPMVIIPFAVCCCIEQHTKKYFSSMVIISSPCKSHQILFLKRRYRPT